MRYHETVAQALAETIVPHGGAFPLGGGDVPLAERLESMTHRLGYPSWPIRLLLTLLDWLPILLFFRLSRFRCLTPDERQAFISRLATSRWLIHQVLFYGIKALVVTIFYSDPLAGAAIGYPGTVERDPVNREPVSPR
ncbi:MAG: hypothetical protein HYT87_14235 [Nitrospirae bacterium]|nr:hypothetical protein [Nitrospirota bacterium]